MLPGYGSDRSRAEPSFILSLLGGFDLGSLPSSHVLPLTAGWGGLCWVAGIGRGWERDEIDKQEKEKAGVTCYPKCGL